MLSATVLSWCSVFSSFLVLSLHVFCHFFSLLLLHFCHRFFCVLFLFPWTSSRRERANSADKMIQDIMEKWEIKEEERKKQKEAVRVLLHYIFFFCWVFLGLATMLLTLSLSFDKSQCLNLLPADRICVYLWCKSKERAKKLIIYFIARDRRQMFTKTAFNIHIYLYIFLCDLVLVSIFLFFFLFVVCFVCLPAFVFSFVLLSSLSLLFTVSKSIERATWVISLVVLRLGCTICMHWICVCVCICHSEIIVKFYTARNNEQYERAICVYVNTWPLCKQNVHDIKEEKRTWKMVIQ